MAKNLQFRRGNTAQTLANTMASGELFINTDQNTISVGDGLTPGGFHLATQTQLNSNVATLNASIASNVSGLATCSLLSNTCSVLNSNITALGTSLNQCFNTKTNSTGGSLCNAALSGTLNAGGSNGTAGQVLCSSGSGVAWATASGANYFQAASCNIFFCPITTPLKASTACYNIGIGVCSLFCVCSACCNVAIGKNALKNVMYGSGNIGIGPFSGSFLSGSSFNSSRNIAIGHVSMNGQSVSLDSISIGTCSGGFSNLYCSIAIGYKAQASILISKQNVAIGKCALFGCSAGTNCNNVAIGTCVLACNCSGNFNVAIGYLAGKCTATGFCNIAIGYMAGCSISTGSNNVILGPYSGSSGLNCTLVINTGTCQRLKIDANGLCVNGSLVSGGATYCKTCCNLFLSPASCSPGLGTFSGKGNFAAGSCSLANVCGSYNVGIGTNTLRCSSVAGAGNSIALGRNSLAYSCYASKSIGIGGYTGSAFACSFGVFIGHFAHSCAACGKGNIAIGAYAMKCGGAGNCTTNNVAIGYKSGCAAGSTTGAAGPNVLIGAYTGSSCSGQQNTIIGSCAGQNISGTNNTLIGYNASALAPACCNTITLGNANITTIRSQQTSITALSDYRDKAYIETLPVGLEFLRQVRPVTFTWRPRDTNSTMTGRKEAGFIAQELETVANNSIIKDWLDGFVISNEDRSRLEATPGKMFPLIVKAIQELATENDSLKTRVTALEAAINK